MKTIEEKKRDRFLFLNAIYEASGGDALKIGDLRKIGLALGFEQEYFGSSVYPYLIREGLISQRGTGYNASITHEGIKEVEQALSAPNEPTDHFPALNLTVNNFSNNSNSVIQTGDGNKASIKVYAQDEKNPYEAILPLLKQFLQELDDEKAIRAELEAEISSMEAQIRSPKPKFLLEIGKSIRSILEGLAIDAVSKSPLYAEILRQLQS